MTPKENWLMMMRGEIPEFVPSGGYIPHARRINEDLLTPASAPDGPIVTTLGVTYIGSEDNNWGAMPEPGNIVLHDITQWRDVVKIADISDINWEMKYKPQVDEIDRNEFTVGVGGGDYFLTLVSLMGFNGALLAMIEEPEEVKALLTHISEFYTTILKHQFYWTKPDVMGIMDDDASEKAPFFSLEIYRDIFKPFHKLHCDIALENGAVIDRHDCGKSESFIDDWLDIGIRGWNSVQIMNDCVAIKQKYVGRLALAGMWNMMATAKPEFDDPQYLKDKLVEYVDTYAPGGGFSFGAGISGPMGDPKTQEKRDLVKEFYFDYVKDWYKNH
ncbi:MAG: hypothetical protein FWG88_08260 [Oscillospiraceae bacterium]|nr:hypothetical protein [Oscillospiraceae bacterium]